MKISKKDIQLLTALAGFLIAAAAYFLVYTTYMDKAESLEQDNVALAGEVTRLETLDAKKDTYIAYTEEMKAYITDFENRFPADILPEDSILTVKAMEIATQTSVGNISFGTAAEVTYGNNQTTADTTQSAEDDSKVSTTTVYADTHLYEVPLGISIQCGYEDFKSVIRYIYGQQNRMSVDGVNIGYDAATNQLTGNMTLNTYYLLGTDKVYAPLEAPSVGLGVDTVFGNID